jgi:hypothetical protein
MSRLQDVDISKRQVDCADSEVVVLARIELPHAFASQIQRRPGER